MTKEQSVYKMLKYLARNKYYILEISPNNFSCKYSINIDAEEYHKYASEKLVYIDFNTKTTSWYTKSYDYGRSQNTENRGDVAWDECMTLLEPELLLNIRNNIEYRLLKAEEERTHKVRQLRVACEMRRELNAIEELV